MLKVFIPHKTCAETISSEIFSVVYIFTTAPSAFTDTQSKSYLAFYCQLSSSEILTVSAIQDKPHEHLTQYKTSCIMLQQRTLSLFRFNQTSVINLIYKSFITGGFLLDREKV